MFLRRLYYIAKPYLPWRARIAARRVWAGYRRRSRSHAWPINEAAGRVPAGWPGWPGGQPFALVLTHDVESAVGVSRVRALAELEMSLGFRSSFGFVPEGEYEVPAALIEWLVANGFEVVVHDLHHNGSLYQSRAAFAAQAVRINHYLKKWGAVGFRSGFMLRQLEWLQMLDIEYDASTFDTDPFEPQPDGAGTIFPYWVPRSAKCEVQSAKGRGHGIG